MEFEILGRTALRVAGNSIDLGSARARGLLALLLYEVGTQVPVDRIVGVLWPELPLDAVQTRLYPLVSRLRKALMSAGLAKGDLIREGRHYRLNVDPELVDFHRFVTLSGKARAALSSGDPRTAHELIRTALALWRGTPLADLSGPTVEHNRNQMVQFYLTTAQHTLLDCLLALGDYPALLTEAGRLTQQDQLVEPFAVRFMQGLDGVGDYARALSFYEQYSALVMEEIGSNPGPEAQRVYRSTLRKQSLTDPARSGSAIRQPPRQLPRRVPNFVGRGRLLTELDDLLEPGERGPVVVLHGMPCVGKTSLATEWGNLRREHFPDGQLFLDLRGYGSAPPMSAHDAMGFLLSACGVPQNDIPAAPDERVVQLNHVLDGRRMLLVLDNAMEGAQVRPLLAGSARCSVLITSRTRMLGLLRDGVRMVHVPPLRRDESLTLLRAELRDTSAADHDGLHALAKRSADLPLSVKILAQLAAQRGETPLADFAAGLAELPHSDVLDAGDESDADAGTLWILFSWSYQALPVQTALVFRHLGLLPGTEFGAAAVAALVGLDKVTVERHLKRLASMSLLFEQGPGRRYRIHDLMNEFAVGMCEQHETAEERQRSTLRVLDWYLHSARLATALASPDVPPLDPPPSISPGVTPLEFRNSDEALAWFHQERANIISAIHLAAGAGHHEHVWRLVNYVHDTTDTVGAYYGDLLVIDQLALHAARATGSRVAECGTLNNIGLVMYRLRRYGEAKESLESALRLAKAIGNDDVSSTALHNLATLHLDRSELDAALRLFKEALALARRLGSRQYEATVLHQIGKTFQRMEQDDTALVHYRAALSIRDAIGDVRGQGASLTALAVLHRERGEPEVARDRAERALVAHQKSGDLTLTFTALLTLAGVYLDLGQFEQSVARATEAIRLSEAIPFLPPHDLARALHLRGHAESAIGKAADSVQSWLRAVGVLDGLDDPVANALRDQLLAKISAATNVPRQPCGDDPRPSAPGCDEARTDQGCDHPSVAGE